MKRLGRRRWLAAGCAHCLVLAAGGAWAQSARLARPGAGSDEGGLWAIMDREETRLRRGSFLMRDAALRDYLTAIACKLGGEHCADTRVYPVRAPLFNASMAPNGMMQVWSGLLLRVENEAQLAAVIGHEVGHYLKRHSLQRLRDAKDRSALAAVLSPLGVVGLVGQMAALAGHLAYSRDHEREADRVGVALMKAAAYDPLEAPKVWANLRAELAANPQAEAQRNSVLFASHPPSDERQATLAELAGAGGGFVGEAEHQAAIEPLLPDLLDDELKRAQYDESIALFSRLADRRPARGDLRYFRGEARRLRAQGDDEALALADLQAAVALDKAPPQAHRALGLLHRGQGRKDDAAAAFKRYLEVAPQAADAAMIQSYLSELT